MTKNNKQQASFIKSRKHARVGAAPALAMLATLGMPAAHAAPDNVIDQSIPTVQVTGANVPTGPVSANDKFTAPLLDTPKSVTVVTAETISQTGAVSLTDALRTVPGITIGAGEGGNPVGDNLFIRGYNAQTDTYIDGIRDAGSQSREIFNLEQVEVVKGPNSAYGGRSSAGGGVNLVSKTAQGYDFNSASVGIGSDKYKRITGDVNRALGSNSAFRLNVMAHENDVPGRKVVGGNRWGVAPTVTFGLNGPDRAIVSVYHLTSHEIPDTGIPFNNPITTGANVSKNGNGTPFAVDRETFYGLANRDFRDTKSDVGTIDLRHEFSKDLALRNVTRYGKSTNDYVWTQPDDSKGNTVLYGTVWRRANTRATETRTFANVTSLSGELTTAGLKHSFNAGVEFDRETTDRSSYIFTPGTNNPLTGTSTCPTSGAATLYNCTTLVNPNPYDPWVYSRSLSGALTHVNTKTKAAYAFDTIEINPQWLLNLGVRWDDFQSTLDTLPTATTAAAHAVVDTNFVSSQAGIVFKPSKNGSIYLSFASSATPPGNDGGDGLDALTAVIQNLQPQRSRNIEHHEQCPRDGTGRHHPERRPQGNPGRGTRLLGQADQCLDRVRRLYLAGRGNRGQRLRRLGQQLRAVAFQRQPLPDHAEEQRLAVDQLRLHQGLHRRLRHERDVEGLRQRQQQQVGAGLCTLRRDGQLCAEQGHQPAAEPAEPDRQAVLRQGVVAALCGCGAGPFGDAHRQLQVLIPGRLDGIIGPSCRVRGGLFRFWRG
jgi:catecholate siderophore receptor